MANGADFASYICPMGRVLAIDYGEKRCGLAVSDPSRMIANGLDTAPRNELDNRLREMIGQGEIDCIVIGQPKRMSGEASSIEQSIQKLVATIAKNHPEVEIARMDERFTSKIAFDTMLATGTKKKNRKDKSLVDKISATIILQDYLDSNYKR